MYSRVRVYFTVNTKMYSLNTGGIQHKIVQVVFEVTFINNSVFQRFLGKLSFCN